MYVSVNPNQVVANSQGYHSGVNAFPIGVRPSIHGNTITYAFNPTLASATISANPYSNMTGSWSVNPAIANTAFNANIASQAYNPAFTSAAISPVVLANNAFTNQASAFNPIWSSQAFNSGITSGNFNMNSILSSTGIAQMRVDLAETNSDVVVAAELPNVSLNDMILTVTDDSVSITATAWVGSSATSLYRTIALPTTIKSEQVEATYSNGILEVRAPKSDVVTRRKIKVNVTQ